MMDYVIKPATIKKSQILEEKYSFSGFSYRSVKFKNKTVTNLGHNSLLSKNVKGFEPGKREYINFSENYFIRISEMDNLNFSFGISKDTKKIRPVNNVNKNKFIVKGDICYQTASNVGNVCFYDGKKAFYNSHIRKLDFKKNKFYIFAILKSKFGKEQVDVTGSIKGVDNFVEELLSDTQIPFPTSKNNSNPKKIEQLISLIVQNILNKEEQIKKKNKIIDLKIETEIKKNQKPVTFSYSYPKISEIKKEGRLDTGLYEKRFKQIDFFIKNYKKGVNNFEELNLKVARGQNLQISNIGLSYYSDEKINDNFYSLVLSKYFGSRTIEKISYLGSKKKLKEIKIGDIIFSCRGEMGKSYFFPEKINKIITNIDNVHIASNLPLEKQIFIFLYLGFLKTTGIIDNIACTGSGAPSFTQYHFNKLLIPNFPKKKQQEIVKLYHNKIDKNKDLTFENYLEREKRRNNEIGIFQLNMEVFSLREILERLVHNIVMEEKIELTFDY